MTNQIYLAWQDQISKQWHIIGQLLKTQQEYEFRYTQGIRSIAALSILPNMPEYDKVYRSANLFSLFKNRLMSKSRPEYYDYLNWLGFDSTELVTNELDLLAISGGAKETDFFRVIPVPQLNTSGHYAVKFFMENLKFVKANSLDLSPRKLLYLLQESQPIDRFALTLQKNDPSRLIGYVPGCFTRVIQQIKKQHDELSSIINIRVLQVNNHAPSQMQFLCELSSPALQKPLEKYENEFKPMLS